jgi:outer membrane protein assembly factor BamB
LSSPASAEDGTIYVGGDRGLLALNPDDNGTIWIASLAELNRVNPDGHGTRQQPPIG